MDSSNSSNRTGAPPVDNPMALVDDAPASPLYRRVQPRAKVAELVDALVLGTSGVTRESSSLSFRTI